MIKNKQTTIVKENVVERIDAQPLLGLLMIGVSLLGAFNSRDVRLLDRSWVDGTGSAVQLSGCTEASRKGC